MPRTVATEYATPTQVSPGTSGVKSTPGQGKETRAFMPRQNLLSLVEDFNRFASKLAVHRNPRVPPGKADLCGVVQLCLVLERCACPTAARCGRRFEPSSNPPEIMRSVKRERATALVVNNSADGRMPPFQSGIGLRAENLGIPVVPMRLDGVWQMKRERRRLARLGENHRANRHSPHLRSRHSSRRDCPPARNHRQVAIRRNPGFVIATVLPHPIHKWRK